MVTLMNSIMVRNNGTLKAPNIREQIATLKCKVFNHQVQGGVCVLNTRNANVSNLRNESATERVGMKLRTRSTIESRITFRMSIQSFGLNLRLPSLSKSRSRVRRAQSSPKRLLSGSSPMVLNQVPMESKRRSK